MRVTDDRYRRERDRMELALRLIGHEARTGTIRYCTGLSEDRIRKLYDTYFRFESGISVRRRRGKSPRQCSFFFRSVRHRFEATTLATLFLIEGLLAHGVAPLNTVTDRHARLQLGESACDVYEFYVSLHQPELISFEWAWNLLGLLRESVEVKWQRCATCSAAFVIDALALAAPPCPRCELAADPLVQEPGDVSRSGFAGAGGML